MDPNQLLVATSHDANITDEERRRKMLEQHEEIHKLRGKIIELKDRVMRRVNVDSPRTEESATATKTDAFDEALMRQLAKKGEEVKESQKTAKTTTKRSSKKIKFNYVNITPVTIDPEELRKAQLEATESLRGRRGRNNPL
jgi:hypothetical protein|mmetsp:Transcript_11735/g.25860  ORF Transcript_11735/g.25860 Transcript_11735/m.25860 type:complete len:141 (-) Transcript_11735:62-484(-)